MGKAGALRPGRLSSSGACQPITIPVPSREGLTGRSLEGIWQALKVFRDSDVDPGKLEITTMKGPKRAVRRHGPVQGHRTDLHGGRRFPPEEY
ncbi:DUF6939 family protein [Kitasatospora sp. NPDC059648]|uniref:DUF6939 family protein n=1 Tax=Kitasatospora sp. NPDC059648 TaxID=3346894 RepID=UPI0036B08664